MSPPSRRRHRHHRRHAATVVAEPGPLSTTRPPPVAGVVVQPGDAACAADNRRLTNGHHGCVTLTDGEPPPVNDVDPPSPPSPAVLVKIVRHRRPRLRRCPPRLRGNRCARLGFGTCPTASMCWAPAGPTSMAKVDARGLLVRLLRGVRTAPADASGRASDVVVAAVASALAGVDDHAEPHR